MPVSKGDKRAKATKSKSKVSPSKKKGGSSTSKTKKEGTRVGLLIDFRGAGKKKASTARSRDKVRDGR